MNIENFPSVIIGARTIDSEDVAELWCIRITAVDHNKTLDKSIPSVGASVTERGICDGKVWRDDFIDHRRTANHHCSVTKLPSVSPSTITNLNLLDYFLILFPMGYVKVTMIPGIN